jgi:hypothetical protein
MATRDRARLQETMTQVINDVLDLNEEDAIPPFGQLMNALGEMAEAFYTRDSCEVCGDVLMPEPVRCERHVHTEPGDDEWEAHAEYADAQLAQSSAPVAAREVTTGQLDELAERVCKQMDLRAESDKRLAWHVLDSGTTLAPQAFLAARQDRAAEVTGEWDALDELALKNGEDSCAERGWGEQAERLRNIRLRGDATWPYRLAPTDGRVLVEPLSVQERRDVEALRQLCAYSQDCNIERCVLALVDARFPAPRVDEKPKPESVEYVIADLRKFGPF